MQNLGQSESLIVKHIFFLGGGEGLTVIILTTYLEILPFSWHAHHKEVAHG